MLTTSNELITWLPVPDYEEYYKVSSTGLISGIRRKGSAGGILKQAIKQNGGYPFVQLCKDGLVKVTSVHIVVAAAFLGQRPIGQYVRHLDGNPLNNNIENLAYGTPSENSYDTVSHGRHPLAKATHCKWGHEFNEANTKYNKSGHRSCRNCARRRNREYRLKQKKVTQ